MSSVFEQLRTNWSRLSRRERVVVGITIGVALLLLVSYPLNAAEAYRENLQTSISRRLDDLKNVNRELRRLYSLRQRAEQIQQTLSESQMSVQEVTSTLDRYVRQAIGSDKYDLKQSQEEPSFGGNYIRQDFTLSIQTVTVEQLFRLLFEIERGGSNLILGNVEIGRGIGDNTLRVILKVHSIRKATA